MRRNFILGSLLLSVACEGRSPPGPPSGLPARAIASGANTTCAALDDGSVRCWGSDLLDPGLDLHVRGMPDDRCSEVSTRPLFDTLPREVQGVRDAIDLGLGEVQACARDTSNGLFCWGRNSEGELGVGSFNAVGGPARVALEDVQQVDSGFNTTCAVLGDGTARCWGNNSEGQLGNGTTDDSAVPVTVVGLSGATQIGVGILYACAATGSGEVWCWGASEVGELGDGTTAMSPVPVRADIDGVVSLAVGFEDACALRSDGAVLCWGDFNAPSVSVERRPTPPTEIGRGGYVSLYAGWFSFCGIRNDGSVDCWGTVARAAGIATDDSILSTFYSQVPFPPGVVELSIGAESVCALTESGEVHCLGGNVCGELGDGTMASHRSSASRVAL